MDAPSIRPFLDHGLLPENLPPAVTSAQLWQTYDPAGGAYLVTSKVVGRPCFFNASKRGGQRRVFSIPHPTFVHDAAAFLTKNWPGVETVFALSPNSLSKPRFLTAGPRAVRITPHSELPRARLRTFSRFQFCAVTDVARYYPSVYTHSVPWAINGKTAAKADHKPQSAKVTGNRLDFILRQAQDAQTIGIPIGPDTSKIIGETILSAIDDDFLSKYGKRSKPTYLRHVDDYWLGGESREECEHHLRNLRASLREYGLDLNDLKTRILSTNRVLGESWPSEFERELKASLSPPARGYDAVATLSKIVDAAVANDDDGVIRHTIRKIDENGLWVLEWDILEHFLAQCAIQFSHAFDYVARVVAWRIRRGFKYDKALWTDVAKNVVSQAAALGRDGEALWGLWLLSELRVSLPKLASDALVRNSSPLVLGYLAHMFRRGRTRDKNLGPNLWAAVEGNPYCGPSWPLALELVHLGIGGGNLASFGGTDVALKNIFTEKRSLINWSAPMPVFMNDEGHPISNPGNAIEDFTSDYDDDSDEDDNNVGWAI